MPDRKTKMGAPEGPSWVGLEKIFEARFLTTQGVQTIPRITPPSASVKTIPTQPLAPS